MNKSQSNVSAEFNLGPRSLSNKSSSKPFSLNKSSQYFYAMRKSSNLQKFPNTFPQPQPTYEDSSREDSETATRKEKNRENGSKANEFSKKDALLEELRKEASQDKEVGGISNNSLECNPLNKTSSLKIDKDLSFFGMCHGDSCLDTILGEKIKDTKISICGNYISDIPLLKEKEEHGTCNNVEMEVQKLVACELERRSKENEETARIAEDSKQKEIRASVATALREHKDEITKMVQLETERVESDNYEDIFISSEAASTYSSKDVPPIQNYSVNLRIDALNELSSLLNLTLKSKGLSLSALLLKAALLTIKDIPKSNSKWMGDYIRISKKVDVNIPVHGKDGSISIPVLKNASSKGLKEMVQTMQSFRKDGATNSLDEDDRNSGTFAFYDFGIFGSANTTYTPVLPKDQASLLIIGAPEQCKILSSDKKSTGSKINCTMVTVTLVCDGRILDVSSASKWLSIYKSCVENPTSLFLALLL